MEIVKIPIPSALPKSPDPLNLIRQKVAGEVQRASVYQKHVSVVFKQDPLLCTREMKTSRTLAYPVFAWNMPMFEEVAKECRKMGYRVEVKEQYKTANCGSYGVHINDRVVMNIKWESAGDLAM